MDIWEAFVYILLMLLTHEADGEYCQYVLQNSSATIVKVCQDNKGTDSIIYLDSTGAPLYDVDRVCTCILTHYNDTGLQKVYIFIISDNAPGVEFEINSVAFENNGDNKTLDVETGTAIVLQQGSRVTQARTCLVLDASLTNNITVECKADRSEPEFTSKQTAIPTKRLTTTTTLQQDSSKLEGINRTSLEVTKVSDKPNPPLTTEMASDDISDKGDGKPNFVMIGGAAGSGVFLVIVIVVILTMFRKRSKNGDSRKNERENRPRDNIYDSDYYMTTNAQYVSAASVTMGPNRDVQDVPLQMDTIHDHVEYAVVNKSRVNDTRGRDKPEDGNDYNHLYEIQPRSVSNNVYARPITHTAASNSMTL